MTRARGAELAAQERAEIEIITAYLPKQMSDIEAGAAISAMLQEINAETMKDMGRAMAALKERFAGKMDFGKASGKIKELLSKKCSLRQPAGPAGASAKIKPFSSPLKAASKSCGAASGALWRGQNHQPRKG